MAGGRGVVLAAGGTGGHVFPAQALAEELLARDFPLSLITDHRGEGYGDALARIDTYRIGVVRMDGGLASKVKGVAMLGRAVLQARRLLKRLAPGAVVGFGGYPSVPTMLAAAQSRLPTMIHEQNAVLGRANGLLAPRVSRIATSFASVAGIRPGDAHKATLTGNPVRAAIAALHERPYPSVDQNDGRLRVLVFGGSQGASILSDVVPAAVARLPDLSRARLEIAQQCRPEDLDRVGAAYRECGFEAELAGFFDDVPRRLAEANLVISRAGASTVAELAVSGRPAILVPFPQATDDHQTANARALDEAGGAWLFPQSAFTPEAVALRLESFLNMPETLTRAAQAASSVGQPDAARRLADMVETLVNSGDGGAQRRQPPERREKAA